MYIIHTVLKGTLKIGDTDSEPLEAFHTLVFSSAKNETGVAITAVEDNTEAILVSGHLHYQ